jgi:hypothetical protein
MKKSLLLCLCLLSPVLACATFYPEDFVGFLADETALIVWDEESRTEHFIRRASFSTNSETVGFVVPTPSRPKVEEFDDEVFSFLERSTRPKRIVKKKRKWVLGSFFMLTYSMDSMAGLEPEGVRVYEQGAVAGQDYAILKADNAAALEKWLSTNGFPFPESSRAWVEPYIEDGFFLTAFKYRANSDQGFHSETVKLSFSAEHAYYPYREPDQAEEADKRSLKLYLLSTGPTKAMLESGQWNVKMPYSAPTEGLPESISALTEGTWLSVFEDDSPQRNGLSDLRFVSNPQQAEVHPPDQVVTRTHEAVIPIELVILFLLVGVGTWRRFRA